MSEKLTKHYIIHGRVQGVGYRNWTVQRARKLGIDGWVRNRSDGTVEAVLSGAQEAIDAMEAAFQKGPMMAKVSKVDITPSEETPPPGFEYKETV